MSDAAAVTVVAGALQIVALVVGFLTLWVKLKYGEDKIDANTRLTRDGTSAAANNAKLAADTAEKAKVAADVAATKATQLNQAFNGGLDERIEAAVRRVLQELKAK